VKIRQDPIDQLIHGFERGGLLFIEKKMVEPIRSVRHAEKDPRAPVKELQEDLSSYGKSIKDIPVQTGLSSLTFSGCTSIR